MKAQIQQKNIKNMYLKDYLMKRKKQSNFIYNFTPVTAVSVHVQANGRKYHGDLAIMKSPNAYEVANIKTDFHAFMLSISNTF